MVVVVILGVVAGYLSGGRLSALANLRLRWLWLLLPAAAAALVPQIFHRGYSVAIPVAGLLLLAFLVINGVRQRRGIGIGMLLMSVGWLLNLVVVALNGGMPTPAEVLHGSTWWPNLWLMPHMLEHVHLTDSTRLPWLADAIELRFAHMLMPVSVGDILLYAGGATFICAAMRHRQVHRHLAQQVGRDEGRDADGQLAGRALRTAGRLAASGHGERRGHGERAAEQAASGNNVRHGV